MRRGASSARSGSSSCSATRPTTASLACRSTRRRPRRSLQGNPPRRQGQAGWPRRAVRALRGPEAPPGRPLHPLLPPGRAPDRRARRVRHRQLHLEQLVPGGRSHPLMRESLLRSFDKVWIDNLHGNRLASERTPGDGHVRDDLQRSTAAAPGSRSGRPISTFVKTVDPARRPGASSSARLLGPCRGQAAGLDREPRPRRGAGGGAQGMAGAAAGTTGIRRRGALRSWECGGS